MTSTNTDTIEEEVFETTDEQQNLRNDFRLPKKIKAIKLIIAIVINILMGGMMVAMGIIFFVSESIERTFYVSFFAAFMILFGGALIGYSPITIGKTINSRLVLTDQTIKIRNLFRWNIVRWEEVEEVMVRQKLKKDLDLENIIGIDIVRFRTVAGGTHYFADNYPADDAEEIIQSVVRSFEDFLENTDYYVAEKAERPSLRYRYLYFNKTLEKNN